MLINRLIANRLILYTIWCNLVFRCAMKLNDKIQQMSDEGKSVEEITDYILERIKEEKDRKRTIKQEFLK